MQWSAGNHQFSQKRCIVAAQCRNRFRRNELRRFTKMMRLHRNSGTVGQPFSARRLEAVSKPQGEGDSPHFLRRLRKMGTVPGGFETASRELSGWKAWPTSRANHTAWPQRVWFAAAMCCEDWRGATEVKSLRQIESQAASQIAASPERSRFLRPTVAIPSSRTMPHQCAERLLPARRGPPSIPRISAMSNFT